MIHPTYLVSCFQDNAPRMRLFDSMKAAEITSEAIMTIGESFDYSAIIEVLEDGRDVGDHVVLLHDTMEVTPETPALIEQADAHSGAVAAFGGQCNLGLYRMDYLMARRSDILAMKNCTKKQAIDFEGRLWRECPTKTHFPNGQCIVEGKGRPYGGAERITELYTALMIRKFKANYGATNESNYVLTP